MLIFTDTKQSRRQAGVTLVELMIAMAVLAIILVIAVPSFRESTANAAMRGTAMDLTSAINAARADAVSLRVPVTFSAIDPADWSLGWRLAYGGGQASNNRDFTVRQGMQIAETGGLDSIEFRVNGSVDNEAVFTICDGRSGETGRIIRLNRLGRLTNGDFAC